MRRASKLCSSMTAPYSRHPGPGRDVGGFGPSTGPTPPTSEHERARSRLAEPDGGARAPGPERDVGKFGPSAGAKSPTSGHERDGSGGSSHGRAVDQGTRGAQ